MNFKYFIPARYGGSANNLWKRLFAGRYEKDVVNFYQKHAPYGVSVDIGAGVGFHTRKLAKISKRVIAIEPLADLVGMPDNVEVHKVAVGRKYGTAKIVEGHNQKTVKVVPLNEIVTEANFLKIDTEGYEVEILESSPILDSVKFAMIEIHNVKDLIEYQTRIFRLLKNFQVFASEIKSYVTLKDVPLKERTDRHAVGINVNNHRLLCVRK